MSDDLPKSPAVIPPLPNIEKLRRYTDARLALGRAGAGVPTRVNLSFMLDHARARDSVWSKLDTSSVEKSLENLNLPIARVKSEVKDRSEYLRRPDLGRKLDKESAKELDKLNKDSSTVIVIADGLSAVAVELNAAPLVNLIAPSLEQSGYNVAGIVFASDARVAIGDDVANYLNAQSVILLVGERPGLSASDSLGCYMTWQPTRGTPDSRRNCISNIRSGGLSHEAAARQITWLVKEMARLRLSGVDLKDDGLKEIN